MTITELEARIEQRNYENHEDEQAIFALGELQSGRMAGPPSVSSRQGFYLKKQGLSPRSIFYLGKG